MWGLVRRRSALRLCAARRGDAQGAVKDSSSLANATGKAERKEHQQGPVASSASAWTWSKVDASGCNSPGRF